MIAAIGKTDCVDVSNTRCPRIAPLCVALGILCSCLPLQAAPEPIFSAPKNSTPVDQILLLSTRSVGTVCTDDAMNNGLQCLQFDTGVRNKPSWVSIDWQSIFGKSASNQQTVIYVHGNRVAQGEDRFRGMMVYHSLRSQRKSGQPIRFIIWSWPSSAIPGPLKDYQIKANRTRPVSWQLAWFLNRMPPENSVSIFGYSYGARVTSGAMHLLGGGSLGNLQLAAKPQLPTFRIALVAAAFNADWLQPRHFHGRAVGQSEHVTLTVNPHDPAMRFFHLSNGRGRVHALGKTGITNPQSLGLLNQRIQSINMTRDVGRSHFLKDYLAASSSMKRIWQNLIPNESGNTRESLAGMPSSSQVE